MDGISILKAQKLAQQRGLSPKDFVGYDPTMPNRWNNQALADALGMNIMSTGSRNQRVLASPTASQPAPTSEDVLARYGSLGATDFNMLDKPTSYLTPKGKADYIINQPLRAAELQAMSTGMNLTPEQINTAYGSGYTGAVNDYNDWLRWKAQDESRGGLMGFLDKATPAITKAAFAYFGGNALGNALNLGNTAALAPGTVPTASAPVMIPGTEIPLSTAANVGRTAYNVARSDDPARALTNAAFRYGSNFQPSSDWRNLSVFQDLGKRYGVNLGQPDFGTNVKTPDIVPQNFDKGGKYESEIRPTPEQRPTVGALARLLQQADTFVRKPFGYDNPPVQVASDFLMIPQLYRTMENYAYGSPLTHGTSSVSRYLPRLNEDTKGAIEASLNLVPLVGPAARATTAGATALGRLGERAAARAVPQIMERRGVGADLLSALASGTTSNVIKPKGGNWLAGHVERALEPLKSADEDAAVRAMLRANPNLDPEAARQFAAAGAAVPPQNQAINRWIDTKLNKYIRNEMATPEDPVRSLAERNVLHVSPNELNYRLDAYGKYASPGQEFKATSDAAKMWEGASDNAINAATAGDYTKFMGDSEYAKTVAKNPWLTKVPPETKVYGTAEAETLVDDLGFPHLIDELKAAMSPTSDLPMHLRLDPKDIDKVTVPQAVERVSKINAWRAEQAAKAEREGMMANLTAEPRLADESLQLSFVEKPGGAWVDIPETINEKGMKLCTSIGKAGGWCTKNEGLAKTYGSGENRLATLLDAEGRPHAQAKITESWEDVFDDWYKNLPIKLQQTYMEEFKAKKQLAPNKKINNNDWIQFLVDEKNAPTGKAAPDITELKPPGNSFNSERAQEYIKRDPQYKQKVTQSVLNFLNSGEWGRVADLHHYDIVDLKDINKLLEGLMTLYGDERAGSHRVGQEVIDAFNHAVDAKPNAPRFMTPRQLREFIGPIEPLEGYAEGGYIQGYGVGGAVDYDPDEIAQLAASVAPGYAAGGLVNYDPAEIDTIVSRIREELHG